MAIQPTRSTRLAQTLTYQPDEASHRQTLARLNDYIAAQLAGEAYSAQFPEVALHLDACVECVEAYNLLYELALAEATHTLPSPVRQPEPDLSFLASGAQPSRVEQVRRALQRVGERIRFQLTPQLLPVLRPALAVVTVRSPADEGRYREILLRLEPDETLIDEWPVTLAAWRDTQKPDYCLIEVMVEPPDRAWPELAGIEVTLTWLEGMRSAPTDAWGLVSFADVPILALTSCRIEVHLK